MRRWIDGSEGSERSDRAKELLKKLPPAETLSPEAIARVRASLSRPRAAGARRWMLVAAAVASFVLLGGGAMAMLGVWTRPVPSSPKLSAGRAVLSAELDPLLIDASDAEIFIAVHSTVELAVDDGRTTRIAVIAGRVSARWKDTGRAIALEQGEAWNREETRRAELPVHVDQPIEPEPKPEPESEAEPVAVRKHHAQPQEPSPLKRESELLAKALQALRIARDPRAALDALDQYGAEFPAGHLREEAKLARIDALLALDRKTEALELLDHLALSEMPRSLELTVLRAELRREVKRCSEAIEDFTTVLAADRRGDLEERALIGRAGCHLEESDRDTAIADLERYLARYPEGRLATAARAQLGAR